jgi:choline dehydrogenase-like flavoprotein
MRRANYDIIIIGTGPGGATLAYALRNSGASILLIERGDFLPQEPENWSPKALYSDERYATEDRWQDEKGRLFRPGVHYFVGGNSKFYGAALPRFRPIDFQETEHDDGVSPAWPFTYEDLEPYYDKAEELYRVHGADDDPNFPRRRPFPHPAVPHEPAMQRIAEGICKIGLTPSSIPLGIDLGAVGACIRCGTCDGYPCRVRAKCDAEIVCVRPALKSPTVELAVRCYARRVLTDGSGSLAIGVEVEHGGEISVVKADKIVVACGAVNSAALLLRSASSLHPNGLANGSDTVGRYYMVHNNSGMVTLNPLKHDPITFQKTIYVNDFYTKGTADHPFPLGQIQGIGKVSAESLAVFAPYVPRAVLKFIAARSVDWWLFTEDVPDRENRITLTSTGRIQLRWKPNNVRTHAYLRREASRMARALGYPVIFAQRTNIALNSHQSGTIRAGANPSTSAVDAFCRSHDVENLFVVDSSFFPSLPAMNPVLTIAANALRVAGHVQKA